MSDLPPAPPSDAAPNVADEFRSLRRSRSDRVVAGVLGGLGRRLGIDPLVLRIGTVVLAIFGGVGVLLYVVAWLLVPAEDEESSIFDQALGRGRGGQSGTVPLALLLAGVGLISGIGIIAGTWDSGVLLLLSIAGLFLLLRRRDEEIDDARAGTAPQQAGFDWPYAAPDTARDTVPAAGSAPASSAVPDPGSPAAAAGDTVAGTPGEPGTPGPGTAGMPTSGWPEGPDWGPPSTPPVPPPEAQPAPPARRRSPLGLITGCTALVAVGVLAVNDVYWADFPPAMYIAVPLGIVALGLIVGAWYGRSRGLIALGILLALALVPATWLSQWDMRNIGDATYSYTTPAQVPAGPQNHGAGSVHYDLSGLTLTDGQTVNLSVEQGAGQLTVTLPPEVDVTVTASVGGGDLSVLGETRDGLGLHIAELTDDDGSPGPAEIVLDLDLGLGNLEVTR